METNSKTVPLYPDCKDDRSFEVGLEFQDYIADLLYDLGIPLSQYASRKYQLGKGETRQGIEIKLDRRILETGNVSIELAEKSRADLPRYTPSGIYRNDNTWLYVQGNTDIVLIFTVNILRLLHQSGRYPVHNLPTIQRYLMPLEEAKRYAAKIITPQRELQL